MSLTILREAWHVARIDHQCDLCYETIYPAETYYCQINVDSGVFNTFKCCRFCSEWADRFNHHLDYDDREANWECWAIGYFCSDLKARWESIVEKILYRGQAPEEVIEALEVNSPGCSIMTSP